MNDLQTVIGLLAEGQDLTKDQARAAFDTIMSGDATPSQIGGFLMALRVKGETVDEIAGAVSIMREKMSPVDAPDDAMDIVGTGGDGVGTYNISTATSLVVAACGVPIAKHGNKALSSKSGSSEALMALGVNLDLDPIGIARCIKQAGIGFMFAPNHHSAMRFVGPSRVELATRTIFNLLGPQANPAGVKKYLLGVFAKEWIEPVAQSLLQNGATSAWVVHGSDGLDEITTTGPTFVSAIENGEIRNFTITPQDAGLPLSNPDDLLGGTPDVNAAAITDIFTGTKNAYRDIVLFNSAAALIVAGKVTTLKEGVAMASETIDTGRATAQLKNLVAVSNG